MTQRLARVLVALLADRVVDARAETLTTQAREAAQGHEADLAVTQIGGLNQVGEGGWSVARRVDPCPLKSAYLPVETALHL